MYELLLFFLAKIDPYLEASMGAPSQRTQRTKVIPGTCNPRWNSSMQFFVRNLNEDVLCLTVFDKDYFAPNGNDKNHGLKIGWPNNPYR